MRLLLRAMRLFQNMRVNWLKLCGAMTFMNMMKKLSLFILIVFSLPLLASPNFNGIAEKVYEKLKEDKLSTLRQECLSFDYDHEDNESIFFSARENHDDDGCGG